MTTASDQPDLPTAAPNRTSTRRRTPPLRIWLITALLASGAIAVGTSDLLADHAYANVAIWALGLGIVLTWAIWFFFRSGYRGRTRLLVLAAVAVALAGFVTLFRLERFSGELVPAFALRFTTPHDQRLAVSAPAGKGTPAAIDLRHTTPDDFPQFLGPRRSAAVEHVALARSWDPPPECLWRQEVGAGWSGFAVVNGHAVTMEQRGDLEMVTCYEVTSGRLDWSYAATIRHAGLAGGVGPRATPTIDGGRVYALGATGHLVCLDGARGTLQWEKDLRAEFGIPRDDEEHDVPHGRAGSPLVVDNRVIVPVGGPTAGPYVALAAYDKTTGQLLWKGGQRQISYSSPAYAELAGCRQVLSVNEDTVGGYDLLTGAVLWEHPWPGDSSGNANVAQPVPVPPNRVFVSKAYGQGALLLELTGDRSDLQTRVIWQSTKVLRTKFTNVTLDDGYLYGLSDGILECVALADGRRQWKEGRYRHGQLLRAGDLLLVLSESGEMVLIEASPTAANHVLGRFPALEGMTWNTIALAGPYLLVRNAEEAACYKLPLRPKSK